MSQTYEQYRSFLARLADLNNFLALAGWDQEVMMPPAGVDFRARQMSTLSGIAHEMFTGDTLLQLVDQLKEDNSLGFVEKRNVAETHRVLHKKKKLPTSFVEEESKTVSEAYQAWMQARQEDSFKVFLPKLQAIVDLQRRKADLQGYEQHPYDALLDDYEPGLTTARVEEVFKDVKTHIVGFINKISSQPQPNQAVLEQNFPKDKQLALCRQIVGDLGYDWQSGRLDLSEHPFSVSMSPRDARITTRVNEGDIQECIWGGIHETGHALYELGLPGGEYGLPSGSPVSLSMHESQSRLWENNVGKSLAFIEAYWPEFQKTFPKEFGPYSAQDFFNALNTVKPDLIRINSDEVTYHLHILLRFEVEKGLIEGSIRVEDLNELWNARIKEYLGLDVPSPKKGVLQDIHWSHGSFGYFPTYSLGSFYAAQFFHSAGQAIPGLQEKIRSRDFKELLAWLRENIHRHGHTYSAEELCQKVTGEGLNFRYFNEYIHKKYEHIYQL